MMLLLDFRAGSREVIFDLLQTLWPGAPEDEGDDYPKFEYAGGWIDVFIIRALEVQRELKNEEAVTRAANRHTDLHATIRLRGGAADADTITNENGDPLKGIDGSVALSWMRDNGTLLDVASKHPDFLSDTKRSIVTLKGRTITLIYPPPEFRKLVV